MLLNVLGRVNAVEVMRASKLCFSNAVLHHKIYDRHSGKEKESSPVYHTVDFVKTVRAENSRFAARSEIRAV